jgi:hypothetical protein
MSSNSMVAGFALKLKVSATKKYRTQLTDEELDEFLDEIYMNQDNVSEEPKFYMDGTSGNLILVIVNQYAYEFYGEESGYCSYQEMERMRKKLIVFAEKNDLDYEAEDDNSLAYFFLTWYNGTDRPNIFKWEK